MMARRAPGLAFLLGTLVFGMLALPAAIGLACVFAAHHLGSRAALAGARS